MKRLFPVVFFLSLSCGTITPVVVSTILNGIVNCLDDVIRAVAIPCERHLETALFEVDWTKAVTRAGEVCLQEAPQNAKDAGQDILESGFGCAMASVASESSSAAAISTDPNTDQKAERSAKFLRERWPDVEFRLE